MDIIGQLLQEQTPIYNKYLSGDFQVGVDNLNPKRELETNTLQSLEDLRIALFLRYKDQIKALNSDGAGTSGSANDLGLPYVNRTRITTTVPMREAASPTSTPVGVEEDLYKMLNTITAFLGGEPITLDDLPFDICNDRTGSDENGVGGVSPGTSSNTTNGAQSTAGLAGAANTGTQNNPSLGSTDTASDLKCIMIELQMLQAIFTFLMWIKEIIAWQQRALAQIYPYIEFIQMVVACILNPAMRQQLIMSLVGQAMAYMISFLTDMLSQWLGNLNLDCILSNSMATVQQIMGQVTVVGDIGSAAGSFMSFNANLAESGVNLASAGVQAAQGNTDALAKALGIPTEDQQQTKSMTAGELFSAAFRKGIAVPLNSVVGIASSVTGTVVGTTVSGANSIVKGAGTTVESTAKLIKVFFPGADVQVS